MKLLRYGNPGAEKPAMLDAQGRMRDLSGAVADINSQTVSPGGLAKLSAIDPATLPLVSGDHRIGPCVTRPLNFVCIGLNYADHAAESGHADAEGADRVHEGAQRASAAPTTTRSFRARFAEDRLGSGARRRHRHPRALRRRGRRAGPRRRLLRRQRRDRARIPARARRHLGQGQGLRHVRPGRPVAGHRATRSPIRRHSRCGSTSNGERMQNGSTQHDDLRRRASWSAT